MGGAGYHRFMTGTTSESSPPAENRAARYPLHITLGAIFVSALVVFGVAVIMLGILAVQISRRPMRIHPGEGSKP